MATRVAVYLAHDLLGVADVPHSMFQVVHHLIMQRYVVLDDLPDGPLPSKIRLLHCDCGRRVIVEDVTPGAS